MAQIKIYGIREYMMPIRIELSDAIHDCVVRTLQYPADKRAHRFIPLEPEEFLYPPGRSKRYTILEISMFEGRSVETKKALIRELYRVLGERLHLAPVDLEITIFETPRHNWGIRGLPGDELDLNYKVEV
jgi:phenylpyruvate tautomerase PptA (4-oxalocrotonate tautomerase family)